VSLLLGDDRVYDQADDRHVECDDNATIILRADNSPLIVPGSASTIVEMVVMIR